MPRSPLALLLVVFALVAMTATSVDAQSYSDAKKRLARGLQAKDFGTATGAVDDLIALGNEKALDTVVELGLKGDFYGLERYIAGKLLGIPAGELLDHLCELAAETRESNARVLLTLVLGSRPEKEAFIAVIQNLYDKEDSVALAALEKLAEKDSNSAIGPLIEALAHREKRGRDEGIVAFEIREVLGQLTHEEFEGAADWKRWWEPREGSFVRPPADAPKKRGGTAVARKPSKFFGIEVPVERIVFLLDVSGSMEIKDPAPEELADGGGEDGDGRRGGTSVAGGRDRKPKEPEEPKQEDIPESRMRLRRVQKELIETIGRLEEQTMFNIIIFNHEIQAFSSGLKAANSRNKRDAIEYVRSFEAQGETWTDHALQRAFETDKIRTIFLLSDGQPRRNEVKLPVDPILDWIQEANRFSRVRIHTIGFEQAGSSMRKFMKAVARQNHGKYVELR